jgi:hypothetical protein
MFEGNMPGQSRDAMLADLRSLRSDLAVHHAHAMKQASAAWLDLAIGYNRGIHPESACVTRRDGTRLTPGRLTEMLDAYALHEARLRDSLARMELEIARASQLEARARARPRAPGRGLKLAALIVQGWRRAAMQRLRQARAQPRASSATLRRTTCAGGAS